MDDSVTASLSIQDRWRAKGIPNSAWQGFMLAPIPFVAAIIAMIVVNAMTYLLSLPLMFILPFAVPFAFLLGMAAYLLVFMGLTRMAIKACVDLRPEFPDLWAPWNQLWKYIVALMLMGALFAGLSLIISLILSAVSPSASNEVFAPLLLFLPFLYLMIRLFFFLHFIIDKGDGPLECLRSSWAHTQGSELKILLLMLALAVVNLIGAIPFGLGLFVTLPVSSIVIASVYRDMIA